MAVPVVSTYSVIQKTLNDVARVQNSLFDAQVQLSSGKKSPDFVGIANDTQEYLSLDYSLGKADQYLADNRLIETRLNSTGNALNNIVTLAGSLKNLIAQRRSGIANSGAFQNQLDGLWKQISSELNTSVNNQYLFSGSRTNTPAVQTTNFPQLAVPGQPDPDYYQGSQQDLNAILQDNTPLVYNVRADAKAFQQVFAGLAMAAEGHADNNDDALKKAYDFVDSGLQGVITLQALVNSNKVQVGTINSSLQSQKLYWQGVQESIGNTDIVSVSTRLAIDQGVLQAAFQAFAKISSLRLSDFLR
ncbi:MAG: hypothetical protein EBV03_00770 [Proteobacteria bacterium]|nr:hypothetical protein [Pseudomonadota bacterium]